MIIRPGLNRLGTAETCKTYHDRKCSRQYVSFITGLEQGNPIVPGESLTSTIEMSILILILVESLLVKTIDDG
jgi:hypothetical protein